MNKSKVKVIEPEEIAGLICEFSHDIDRFAGKCEPVVKISPVRDDFVSIIVSWTGFRMKNNGKISVHGTDWVARTSYQNWIIEIL